MKDRTIVQTDRDAATMFIMRVFNADVSAVWEHFSRKEVLDRWWAPTPWRYETGSLDLRKGVYGSMQWWDRQVSAIMPEFATMKSCSTAVLPGLIIFRILPAIWTATNLW